MIEPCRIRGIPVADVPDHWDRLEPFLQSVAERSAQRWPLNEIRRCCYNGVVQVWVVECGEDWKAVGLTEIKETAIEVLGVTGSDRHLWQDLFPEIEEWARKLGRAHMFINARPGWTKFLKGLGYREVHREFGKKLTRN